MSLSAALVGLAAVLWFGAGIMLGVADYRTRLLPKRLIWPTAAAVWALYSLSSLAQGQTAGLIGAAAGAGACGAILAGVHFAHPPSMGFGDVRLSLLNGLVCGWWGWQAALLGLMAGFVLALPEAVVVLVRHGPRASRPLGPYLVAGTAATLIWLIATRGLAPLRTPI